MLFWSIKTLERRPLPMIDSITSFLGLKDSEVEYCKDVVKNNTTYFYVRLVNRGGRCKQCGTFTKDIKEYRNKKIVHSFLLNEASSIIYNARRFMCPKCGKTFYETNPFSTQYARLTDKTVENVLKLLKNYNETFSSVAKKVHLSAMHVMNIFDEHVQLDRNKLSESIGIDEFYFSRSAKKKYAAIILSLNKGYVIDLLYTREKHRLNSFFRHISKEERSIVKYVSTDMNEVFRDVIASCLPSAKHCIDPFHVIKLINDALNAVRLRVMHLYDDDKRSDEYYLLKHQKHLLFKYIPYDNKYYEAKRNNHFKYELTEKEKQDMLLAIHPDLENAWTLKENYLLFNDSPGTPEEHREILEHLIDQFISSNIPEMINVGFTLSRWKEEILNSFYRIDKKVKDKNGNTQIKNVRVTSGPVEGRNKYIKILLRLANGYVNFGRFRNRAMYVLNKNELYSKTRLKNTVKITKKKKKS